MGVVLAEMTPCDTVHVWQGVFYIWNMVSDGLMPGKKTKKTIYTKGKV